MDEVPLWEFFGRLFGAKVPPDRLAAWGEVWASRGYENRDMVAAVGELARTPADARPNFPDEHLVALELIMRRIVADQAIAGKLPPTRREKLMPELRAELAARKKALAEWGQTRPDVAPVGIDQVRALRSICEGAPRIAGPQPERIEGTRRDVSALIADIAQRMRG